MSRALAAVAAVVAVLLLAACGSDPQIDAAEVEAELVAQQEKKSPDLEVGEASCPEDPEVAEGAKFQCTIDIQGTEATYDITIRSLDDDGARYRLAPASPIIDTTKVEEFLAAQNTDVADFTADCGEPVVRILEVDETFQCELSDGEQSQTVDMRVKDEDGTVSVAG